MNSNTVCLRIFFVLFILIVGGVTVFLYGARALTPLAICLLPTETAEARYTNDLTLVEYRLNSPQQLFHSKIAYAGHTATLLTTSPPTPIVDTAQGTARFKLNLAEAKAGLPPTRWEQPPEPVLNVRFVRAFPSMVVRDLPDASLWRYYADTWTIREFVSFLISCSVVAVVGFFFYRHIRNSRRTYRR